MFLAVFSQIYPWRLFHFRFIIGTSALRTIGEKLSARQRVLHEAAFPCPAILHSN